MLSRLELVVVLVGLIPIHRLRLRSVHRPSRRRDWLLEWLPPVLPNHPGPLVVLMLEVLKLGPPVLLPRIGHCLSPSRPGRRHRLAVPSLRRWPAPVLALLPVPALALRLRYPMNSIVDRLRELLPNCQQLRRLVGCWVPPSCRYRLQLPTNRRLHLQVACYSVPRSPMPCLICLHPTMLQLHCRRHRQTSRLADPGLFRMEARPRS